MSEEGKSGWWGSTLGKLKTALAKTKEAVVDSVIATTGAEASESVPIARTQENPESPQQESASPDVNVFDPKSVSASEPAPATISKPAVTQVKERPVVPIDDDYLEDLEEKLIRADLGITTVDTMVSDLRKQAKGKALTSKDVEDFLKKEFSAMLPGQDKSRLKIAEKGLSIVFVVGVNGTGKTTSIGKLCYRLRQQGKRVLMAAGDTFRAAAETQLEIWAERAQVEIVRLADGSDPGAVVFQGIKRAKEEGYDVLVIDTAGRLHNKANLMAELKKVRTVIDKNAQGASIEALLVLDASTGQNGLQQAKVFTEVCGLTGVILTKLDGTAKGGVIFAIANELDIPVKLIGLGERMEDLRDFEPDMFIEALF
jgi:fused signal recognition particle receptor